MLGHHGGRHSEKNSIRINEFYLLTLTDEGYGLALD